MHLRHVFLAIIAFSFAPFVSLAQTGTPCNQFGAGSIPPQGYGAAWNVFSSSKQLVLHSNCSADTAERKVVTAYPEDLLYATGYRYQGTWQVTPFTGTLAEGSTEWLKGGGSNTFSLTSNTVPNPYYWVAYTCHWSGSVWQCGCKDAACSTPHWQLQGFVFPGGSTTAGGTTSGGTTGGAHANQLKQQYPSLYNENLPYMGLFYGLAYSGDQFLAAPVRSSSNYAARFRAERTGTLTHLSWHNRWEWPGSSDGYSSGDGGSIYGELRADDGSANHYPGALIARTAAYVPSQNGTNNFVDLPFQSPPQIEAGKLYHIVSVQTGSNYASINHSKTVNCMSPSGGPYYGNDFTMLFREGTGAWKEYGASAVSKFSCAMGYVNLKYSDGIWITAGGGWGSHRNHVTLSGSTHGRQRFTVSGPTRRVNGVWLRIGRGGTAPLLVEVKNSVGAVLASKSEPASTFDAGSYTAEGGAISWKYVAFPGVATLESGREFTLELSSAGRYHAAGVMDNVGLGHVPENFHHWSNAKAEFSRNGGSAWEPWPDNTTPGISIDMPALFTLEGGPKSIQSISSD